jgi:hypothetical protein
MVTMRMHDMRVIFRPMTPADETCLRCRPFSACSSGFLPRSRARMAMTALTPRLAVRARRRRRNVTSQSGRCCCGCWYGSRTGSGPFDRGRRIGNIGALVADPAGAVRPARVRRRAHHGRGLRPPHRRTSQVDDERAHPARAPPLLAATEGPTSRLVTRIVRAATSGRERRARGG